ncbi:MAG: hypothetical protein WBW71_06345 [Bacteroidota bacterium]
MDNNLYNLLLRSFDTQLSNGERGQLEHALASSEELRAMRQEIVDMRLKVQTMKGGSFKPFFSERVLERLRKPQQLIGDYFISVFRAVAVGAAVLVIILSVYNITGENTFTVDSALGIHHPTLEQVLALEAPFE